MREGEQQKFVLESRFLLLSDRCVTMKANHNACDFKGSCVPPFIGNNAHQPLSRCGFFKIARGEKKLEETEADDKDATIQTARGGRGGGGVLNNQT